MWFFLTHLWFKCSSIDTIIQRSWNYVTKYVKDNRGNYRLGVSACLRSRKCTRSFYSKWIKHICKEFMCNWWKLFKCEASWALKGLMSCALRRGHAPLISRPTSRHELSRGSAITLSVHPRAHNLWLWGGFSATCGVRPPPSGNRSLAQPLHKWPEKVAESGWWEMNVPGKQEPELNKRTARLLVRTSVSRPACLSSFQTLAWPFVGIVHMHVCYLFKRRLNFSIAEDLNYF